MHATMTEIIFEVTPDTLDGGYIATALGQSIVTQADTRQELHANVREAVLCHFDENARPKMIRLHFVEDEVLAV